MTTKMAEARLEAAKKRSLAAFQRSMSVSYSRQATHPIYPGQEFICIDKANQVLSLAERNEAEADLIIAQAKETEGSV